MLVGARDRDTGGDVDAGAAYVFVRFGTLWATQQILSIDGLAEDHFGESVALSGDLALVGVPNFDILGGPDAGVAYAYTRSNGLWTTGALPLYASGTFAAADNFGCSVALSGDTALIGASGHDVGSHPNAGAAYVITRASGVWSAPLMVTAGDPANADFFGSSIGVSGDTAVIGTQYHDSGTPTGAGAAYVIRRSGGAWNATSQTTLTAAPATTGDWFGRALAVSGDTVLVGAPRHDTSGLADSGAAYVFAPDPLILRLSPTSGRRGAVVTITGKGFGRARGASVVKFGTTKCTKYVSWSRRVSAAECRRPQPSGLVPSRSSSSRAPATRGASGSCARDAPTGRARAAGRRAP